MKLPKKHAKVLIDAIELYLESQGYAGFATTLIIISNDKAPNGESAIAIEHFGTIPPNHLIDILKSIVQKERFDISEN